MEENGQLIQFIFNTNREVIAENENKWTIYIRGSELLANSSDYAKTYYHYANDEMGSITHIVDNKQILNEYEYDAWGNVVSQKETIKNRFKFNGQQLDLITSQYYLRARFYNPVIARFTQEDTYRGDGLNLYAYCANNPVYYVDPSGNECDPTANILRKEVSKWTDEEIQRAVDSVHNFVYNKQTGIGKYKGKGSPNPYSLIVTEDNMVVLAKNNQKPSRVEPIMDKIFGKGNYILANGTIRTHYKVPEGVILKEKDNLFHAEARAIQRVKDEGGILKGARQACSHLSCDSCVEKMKIEGVKNITGGINLQNKGKNGQYKRDYVDNLWTLDD